MAKRAKHSMEEDRISSLPDEVRGHIISFLSLKEAIGTSVLSKVWRIIYPLLYNLDFDDCLKRKKSESYRFMNFVDRVLFYHTGSVDRFGIKCGEFVDSYRVDGWIRSALQKGVRELDLHLSCREFNTLPVGVFTCETLMALRLSIGFKCKFVLKVPAKICFPRLKILHLVDIEFSDDDSIQRLFSSCSVLEESVVDRCRLKKRCKFNVFNPTLKRLTIAYSAGFSNDVEIGIDAPSLVYFKCCYLPERFLLKNMNSIEEVSIDLGTYSPYNAFVSFSTAGIDLFKGISNAQSLHLFGSFAENFLTLFHSGQIPTLPKLTHLNLNGHFFVGWERLLPHLLACFPCLEALDFQVNLHQLDRVELNLVDGVALPSKSFPSFLWTQLKTLKILSFEGEENEVQMVEYFLKNAVVLENFTVDTGRRREKRKPPQWRSMITKKLLKFPRISKNCKLSVV